MDLMISVIIPCRDNAAVIADCLAALFQQTLPPAEVIVVDGGSQDNTAEIVRSQFPRAKLIQLPQSRGFAGACNAGYEASAGRWIAVINSDAVAHPDWLAQMAAATTGDPRVGMVASRVLLATPAGTVDSLGIELTRGGLALLRGRGQMDRPDESRPEFEEVFGPAGSAAMYARGMIEETDFFAPDFFAYYEDADLAFRGRWRGWTCLLANRARVVHQHSYTADRLGLKKRYYLHSNRLRVIIRNWPTGWIVRYLPFILGASLLGFGAAIADGQFLAAIGARLRTLRALRQDLKARRGIMNSRRGIDEEMRGWLKRGGRT